MRFSDLLLWFRQSQCFVCDELSTQSKCCSEKSETELMLAFPTVALSIDPYMMTIKRGINSGGIRLSCRILWVMVCAMLVSFGSIALCFSSYHSGHLPVWTSASCHLLNIRLVPFLFVLHLCSWMFWLGRPLIAEEWLIEWIEAMARGSEVVVELLPWTLAVWLRVNSSWAESVVRELAGWSRTSAKLNNIDGEQPSTIQITWSSLSSVKIKAVSISMTSITLLARTITIKDSRRQTSRPWNTYLLIQIHRQNARNRDARPRRPRRKRDQTIQVCYRSVKRKIRREDRADEDM